MKNLLLIAVVFAAWYWFKNRKPEVIVTEKAEPTETKLKSAWLLTSSPSTIKSSGGESVSSGESTNSGGPAENVSYVGADPGQTNASGQYTASFGRKEKPKSCFR